MTTLNREWLSEIRNRFCDAGQGHVFTWWDELSTEERKELLRQLTAIDLDLLKQLVDKNLAGKQPDKRRILEPSPLLRLPSTPEDAAFREKAREVGDQIIRQGKCAAFVVAGSGDEDLNLNRIKGKYPITPVTGKSIFQLHTEKVLAIRRRYGVSIPFFIMTSEDNYEETRGFFEAHSCFGLAGDDVFFFSQGMLPAVDFSGKLLMKGKGSLHMSPDGHGGSIRSLYQSGALEEMEKRGIEYIFYFQVDNPLTKILDPVFIGCHHHAGAEISSKVVRKRSPEEKLGVLGKVDGWMGVVEYSDLSKDEMYARDEEGQLKFFAGNIAVHILNVSFVRRLSRGSFKLAFHKSEKCLDFVDEKGNSVKGAAKNAIKFESFVFDALQYTHGTISLEVAREEEFSPFKNLEGEDSPIVCRKMLSDLYASWLRKAGFQAGAEEERAVEISPLFALDTEEFCSKVKGQGVLLHRKLFIE